MKNPTDVAAMLDELDQNEVGDVVNAVSGRTLARLLGHLIGHMAEKYGAESAQQRLREIMRHTFEGGPLPVRHPKN